MKTLPPRIALFTDTFDEINGVAHTFRNFSEYCQKRDIHLDIYTNSNQDDEIEECGSVRILRYKPALPIDIYFDMIFDFKTPRVRVIKEFRSQDYDIIHTATPGSMGLNALIIARMNKLAFIGSYHTSLPEYVMQRVEKIVQRFRLPTQRTGLRAEHITWNYMQWYYNQTQKVLAPSEHTKSLLEGRIAPPVGIFTRGVDTERFSPTHRQDHKGSVALYVGRISIEKNLNVLAQVFQGVNNIKLKVVGDGPFLETMKGQLPEAEFTGVLKGEELSRAYASADFFVFPSTTDTFGNVVLEAMSSGLPVIVTNKMGPKEMVEQGSNGFIINDLQDFCSKIELLGQNEELRQKMGRQAREYALGRSWEAVFDGLIRDYGEIISELQRR